jgi:hypothetical protein
MPNQREPYRDTVHLFIGTGRSPWKITIMPFTFINNSMITLRGLIWFFIFKSVSFSAAIPKLFYTQLRLCANLCASSYRGSDPSLKVPVNVLYSRNIVKSCFWGPSEAEGPQHGQFCRCFGSDRTPEVAPQGVFRSRTVSTTVAKWFVPIARGTVNNVCRFGPLRDA